MRYTSIIPLLLILLLPPALSAQDVDQGRFFEQHVRPVLAAHCQTCHGTEKQESGLRLDNRASILAGGDSGPAVIPGNADDSLLVQAVRHDAEIAMPPAGKLAGRQIRAIETWIANGVFWPASSPPANQSAADRRDHWAFQSREGQATPNVQDRNWCRTPIDRFILSQLEPSGLRPAPAADRRTLIRRATFDLIGLPPAPSEIESFVSDSAPDAFGRLVDRLLQSPHHGERWGRHWLDVARYADNKGYVFFEDKEFPWAWTYRDWVINAFNEDLPFDQFVVQQLAADKLDLGDQRRALAAMGFLTVGARFSNNMHDIIDDRIDVVTRGLLGLTVTCARCHDHKFDPVPQADYYSLYGVFRSSIEPTVPPLLKAPPDDQAYRDFEKGLAERLEKLEQFVADQRQRISNDARQRAGDYLLAVHAKRDHPTTENFMLLTEKGELIPRMIERWELFLKRAERNRDPVWLIWNRFAQLPDATFRRAAIDLHAELFASECPEAAINPLVAELFRDSPPATIREVAAKYSQLLNKVDAQWIEYSAGRDQRSTGRAAALPDAHQEQIRQSMYGDGSPAVLPRTLTWGFLDLLPDRPTQAEYQKLKQEVESYSTQPPRAPPRAMVLVDVEPGYEPVVFLRGNPNRLGADVPRRFLSILSDNHRRPFEIGSGRLELARAITDPRNPLTARVFVNRVWRHYFGRGLVETTSDFGLQGELPTHPELLDWLANWFVAHDWSVKSLQRLIMNSAVYQQASVNTPGHDSSAASAVAGPARLRRLDPDNKLLARFHRRRLDFEAMRDAMLQVSGRLESTLGGEPRDLFELAYRRRTVYGFVDRMDLPGAMRTFDFPSPAATNPKRDETTVPTQSLYFLNNDFVQTCAEAIARRPDIQSITCEDERARRIFEIVLQRPPGAAELQLIAEFLRRQAQVQPVATPWRYGFGTINETTKRTATFTELAYWTGRQWQAGPRLPDPELGWVYLDQSGGHPAATMDRCAIRRWTAPIDGTIEITGELRHAVEAGNGVRARIVSSRQGILGQWRAHHSETRTPVATTEISIGDTIDFVVDYNDEITSDEHVWEVELRDVTAQAGPWQSAAGFRGAAASRWQQFAHALLMANEFSYID